MTLRRFGGPNGYGNRLFVPQLHGWLKLPGPVRTPIVHLFRRLGRILGDALVPVDYRPLVLGAGGPGIFDQGQSSACTGHAEVGAAMTRLMVMGKPAPYRLSPYDAYGKGRFIDAPGQPLVDDGAIPESVTRACAEWGICSYDLRPNDLAHVNDMPTLEQIEQGLVMPIRGIYGMTAVDVEQGVQAALAAGYIPKLGILVDAPFENWSGGDPCGAPDVAQALGGHALYVCGWDTWSGGVEYFIGNSWGTGAGEGGFWRVSSSWLRAASDFEVVDLSIA